LKSPNCKKKKSVQKIEKKISAKKKKKN
jgi:hypothetical protein